MDCHSRLRGILTQGSNLGLWHCRQILYHCAVWGSLSSRSSHLPNHGDTALWGLQDRCNVWTRAPGTSFSPGNAGSQSSLLSGSPLTPLSTSSCPPAWFCSLGSLCLSRRLLQDIPYLNSSAFFPLGLQTVILHGFDTQVPTQDYCVPVSITFLCLSFLYLAVIVEHLVMLILPLRRVCAVRGWTFTLGFPIRPWTNILIRDKIFKHGWMIPPVTQNRKGGKFPKTLCVYWYFFPVFFFFKPHH